MKKFLSVGLSVCLLLTAAAPVAAAQLSIRGCYWMPKMHATVQVDGGNNLTGRDFDVTDDLGVGDQNYPFLEFSLKAENHEVAACYTYADYSGNSVLTRDSSWAGVVYPRGTRVDFDLEYKTFDLLYGYRLIHKADILGGLSLYGFAQVKVFDVRTRLRSAALDNSKNFNAVIPVFGADMHMVLSPDQVKARLRAGFLPVGEDRAAELEANLAWTPVSNLELYAGYRILLLKIKDNDVKFNHGMHGPYLGLGVRF